MGKDQMNEVSIEEFSELREMVLELRSAVQAINHAVMKFNEDHSRYVVDRGNAEKIQDEWILNWHAQVTAHTNAMCAISATCAVLLTEAGVEKRSVKESIEYARLALAPEHQELARPIFDAVQVAIEAAESN
jgi:hypothetical protein